MVASHMRAVAAALAAGALVGLAFLACGGDDKGSTGQPESPIGKDPEPYFRDLESDLKASCGGTNGRCHINGSYQNAPKWLGDPDAYVSIRKYRGILPATKDVGDSILLTQVRHAGPALKDAPNDLYRRVADWLVAEVPPPPLPNTGAFPVVTGYNSVALDNVASGLTGARISFLATEANGVLTLNALRLVAPNNANIKVTDPFFVILPRNGKVKAEPEVNGFKGELTAAAGTSVELYSGRMILLQWDPAGALKIAFQNIESTPGQGVAQGCTALDAFKNSALPAMRMPVDAYDYDYYVDGGAPVVVGQKSCVGCHAADPASGEAPDEAVSALDLRGVDQDPSAACAQARNWINFQNKDQSTILLNPTGKGNPVHPMKPVPDSDPIVSGLKAWVQAENEK
jgi:hypothetical protein